MTLSSSKQNKNKHLDFRVTGPKVPFEFVVQPIIPGTCQRLAVPTLSDPPVEQTHPPPSQGLLMGSLHRICELGVCPLKGLHGVPAKMENGDVIFYYLDIEKVCNFLS